MALSDIISKIQAEAEVKAAKIRSAYEERKKEIQAENVRLMKKMENENASTTEEESNKMKLKATMEAEMEAKNTILNAKREFMEEALNKAVETLSSSEKYEDLLMEMLRNSDLEAGEIIPAKGKEDITKKALQKSGKNFSMSAHSANIKGGFILKSEKVEVDNSFETIIKQQLRQHLEIELNKMLFV